MQDCENVPAKTDLPDQQKVTQIEKSGKNMMLVHDNQDKTKISHAEKKARKLIQGLKMQLVTGVSRVAIRKVHNVLIVIEKPEVYRNTAGDVYIVFGKLIVEDVERNLQAAAAEKFKEMPKETPEKLTDIVEEDDEETDDEGVYEQDIDLVATQANVTRTQAIRALKRNGLDIVNAIMDLTS